MSENERQRIISGVKPSGGLHLGHYFGAIREHVEWQERADAFFLIADYHALTGRPGREHLPRHTLEVAATYLACGLDPARAVVYRQSDVPEVTELTWILTTITPMPLLERAVAYKEHRQSNRTCDAGIFNYPVLMAADILLLRAEIVPVGRDQLQHVEIAREIARRFNRLYEPDVPLPVPESQLSRNPFVPGTGKDGEKMSKRYGNTIDLFEPEETLREKVFAIRTDSRGRGEPKDPEASTIYSLYALMASAEEQGRLAQRYRAGDIDYSEAKEMLFERIRSYFAEMRRSYEEVSRDGDLLTRVLADGAERAREVSRATLKNVRAACGLGPAGGSAR